MTTTEVPMRKKEMVSPMESYLSDMNRPVKNRTTSMTTGPKKNRTNTETTYKPFNLPRLASKLTKVNDLPRLANKLTKVPLDEYKRMQGMQEGAEEGMQEVAQNFVNERLNSIPFKNSSINVFDKKRYDISREFDGQEVPGSLTVRPTLSGGTVETERFDIPGSGTNMSRVRKNAEGQPMRRVVRDKNINQ